ncbi:5-oxoprolinase subunit B family protein [Devosia rhizoryzae]|uniref:Allophanate hydrolase subunit 1 n=1 Tax=Devosia rhizoryzae TaxID=2774137 RepID=A0ABX7CBV3_9HYPH|nr:allophanate hydrolase subunit 1 [Devosia rhizoryzae]QQR40674.1 allophanate hydrolase subunit 1 [Devosia rhizoryzae]
MPLGDSALLIRFGTELDAEANRRVVSFARCLADDPLDQVLEIVPSLVSVLVRFDPLVADPVRLSGELSLRLQGNQAHAPNRAHELTVRYDGPDLYEVSSGLGMSNEDFITRHNTAPLRVLATGFAPGFVYCGFHPENMILPRRTAVRSIVPAGSILFAAGQTAIAATDVPTGWHVIGRTDFRNFDPGSTRPTVLEAGDLIRFVAA